jgi:hypothetical protein
MRNPVFIAGIAAVVLLAIVAVAFAATSDGDDDVTAVAPTPTEEIETPPSPTAPPGLDEPTAGPETPIPSEPPFTVTPADPGAAPQLPADRRAEAAPIDGLDLRVAESFPPQYFLNVQAGLPSGCAEQYKHDVSRDGDVITVTVLNSLPAALDTICTAIYGMYELNIALGSDFEPGVTYTVVVNDQETTFTAQ